MKNEIIAIDRRPESLAAIPAQTIESQTDDLVIIKRLVDSYRRIASKNQHLGQSLWQMFFDTRHTSLHAIFLTGTLDDAADVLRNPHNSDLFYGFDLLAISLQSLLANFAAQQDYALVCLDSLVRFAEAIGTISLDNPESYPPISAFPWDADSIIEKINNALRVQ